MAFVRAVLRGYAKYGVDPAAALARAQIPHGQVDEPDARITTAQFEALSDAAMRELDDEALGWFSRRLPWGTYGLLCRASLGAPTLGIALRLWCRHFRLLTDELGIALTVESGEAVLQLTERRDFGAMREFCLVSNLRYVLGYARWVVDSHIALTGSCFAFAAPSHAGAYEVLFPGVVTFSAGVTAVRFDSSYLDLELRRDEAALRAMLKRALPLTVRPYRRDRMIVTRVRALLQAEPQQLHTAETIAARLNISVRSLHRLLGTSGTGLQQIKDEVRFEIATGLLRTGSRPVKQVAHAAGFANDKSFARAFKARTGTSPEDYRTRSRRAV